MKKILVILTGGTIGSTVKSNVINVSSSSPYKLIDLYNKCKTKEDVEFNVLQPLNMLSENLTPKHWMVLINELNNINFSDYEGIIITHGSDTLSYTSAALGYYYNNCSIPIIIIASNYALEDLRSNGLSNFSNAVSLICNTKVCGVYTLFQTFSLKNELFLPTRIVEADAYTDQFQTFGNISLGHVTDKKVVLNENYQNPTYNDLLAVNRKYYELSGNFDNKVMAIKPYPGLDYSVFDLSKKPKAILHYLYHSATACVEDNSYSLINFIDRCLDNGIDFYIASYKYSDLGLYATSKDLLDHGATPLYNISFEAAYVKLLFAYNLKDMSPENFLKDTIYYENLPIR